MSNKRFLPEFKMLVSTGKVYGASTVFKFGKNQDVDTGTTPEDVISWSGLKLFPNAASTISVVSTATTDTTGGTGINTLRLYGLDADYNPVEEEVTMNGTTPVVTTNSFLRITRMYGTLAGSTQRADGTISATHSEGLISEIEIGDGQSGDCTYTVPAGHQLLVDRLTASLERSATGAAAEIHFEVKFYGENVWREQADVSLSAQGSSFVQRDTDLWFVIPEKTDVRVHISAVATNNTQITASFDAILVNTTRFAW